MATTLSTINNLINDRRRDTGSYSINMTTNGFRAITSTVDLMQQLHDWEFTIKDSQITFHKGITWYTLPSNFKAPVDIRLVKNKDKEFAMVSANNFDSSKLKTDRFAIKVEDRTKYLRLESVGDFSQIHSCTEYDSDGTWVAGGDISNVSTDSYEGYDLGSSINFDFDGTVGTLTNSTMTAIDLSKYLDRSKIYLNVYLPTVTDLTSIALKVGSSDSAYYTETVTTDYLGATPVVGWNKFEFDIWDTEVGTPDIENIDYLQATLTYGSSTTDTDFRIENLFVSEDIPLKLVYYSTDMVYDTSETDWISNFNDSSATTDYPAWSGDWDFVTESFIDASLEIIFWITGETEDREKARQRALEILNDLKMRLPSRRRYPELMFEIE